MFGLWLLVASYWRLVPLHVVLKLIAAYGFVLCGLNAAEFCVAADCCLLLCVVWLNTVDGSHITPCDCLYCETD